MFDQEEIKDRLGVMRRQEQSHCCSDYLQLPSSCEQGGAIDQLCRLKMTQWCFNVVDYIKFRRETVCIAMSYLDRFLSSGCPRAQQVINCRRKYQLASMTTLFMAIKINEPVIVEIPMLSDLGKGLYTTGDFRQMETDILVALNWRMHGPTAQEFVLHLLTIMKQQMPTNCDIQKVMELAMYQIELSACDYYLMTQKPSVIATASIWNCVEHSSPAASDTLSRSLFELASSVGIQMENLLSTKQRLQKTDTHFSIHFRPSLITILETQESSCSIISLKQTQNVTISPNCVTQQKLLK